MFWEAINELYAKQHYGTFIFQYHLYAVPPFKVAPYAFSSFLAPYS